MAREWSGGELASIEARIMDVTGLGGVRVTAEGECLVAWDLGAQKSLGVGVGADELVRDTRRVRDLRLLAMFMPERPLER